MLRAQREVDSSIRGIFRSLREAFARVKACLHGYNPIPGCEEAFARIIHVGGECAEIVDKWIHGKGSGTHRRLAFIAYIRTHSLIHRTNG
jgi:hypothetical protein